VSWANELRPMRLSPRVVLLDLMEARALYIREQVPPSEQVLFLTLRLVQRFAYGLGWRAGMCRRSR
jgi:hypothetical protein